jgi:hypothetical protein
VKQRNTGKTIEADPNDENDPLAPGISARLGIEDRRRVARDRHRAPHRAAHR